MILYDHLDHLKVRHFLYKWSNQVSNVDAACHNKKNRKKKQKYALKQTKNTISKNMFFHH